MGVAGGRIDDAATGPEAAELMALAVERAAEDAGSRTLLERAQWLAVPRGMWSYTDPGRLIARRTGLGEVHTVLAEVGILQQALINRACSLVAAGELEVAVIVGGEARYREQQARIAGIEVVESTQRGDLPDEVLRPEQPLVTDVELATQLVSPVVGYATLENALRYANGNSLEAHRREMGQLWERFNRVALGNAHAWNRERYSAEEIAEPGPGNRLLAFPYTKLLTSQWNVDQAGALIISSAGTAAGLGIPRDRLVFLRSGTESNHMVPVPSRRELHRCPGAQIAGRRAAELAGIRIDDIDHLELYSCFPAAVQIYARELGIALEGPLTVTGGMTFAGGPLNNFVFQAMAEMARVLRGDPRSVGLVSSVSVTLTKQGFGIWSCTPSGHVAAVADVSAEVEQRTAVAEVVPNSDSWGTVAGYTVTYDRDGPELGVVVADLPDGTRTVATTTAPGLMADMVDREFCGEKVRLLPDGTFSA
ncbi:MAG: hypothetical protein JJLCMIEE_02970 [Acidimicrobiales bacterium]|nr:MAG: acetyl-CoA acetyltransferase [Actinomycetota bacterium]MBV6509857.1 hypothetical protein [Acidimicrobiales bacterium]RIK06204.1 MAG: acetyl-CoA acetyltransferase [Acidobacteriota bacterium]